ncbi:Predicted arabinose efflux permease, MFS family [Thermostaphylospora chromogena]|uniref:Predicted arabinose efflux permease, MFS family n=1 Tax=Thermostaphylospora chromogena TaxID=35622 RepID=A0A1H1BVG6_9ACTN|nr:MFS transporter [Thermostaphylospora chromogena]SDQ55899.1 Predicted arabinose efflux permease, MFS family [Thermostaphylospora chromogena]
MAATKPARLPGRHRRVPERQATYGEVIAVPEFRALWLGQVFSLLGDQLAQVALAILVYSRTQSALATAAVYALTYLPPILGGPLLSGLADRYPRRRVMLICDVLRALLVALMAVPGMPLGVLCALVFGVVLIGAPFSAARAALLPEILEGDRYVIGSALQNMTNQALQMLGFVAGGALIAAMGPYRALALDAATFLASALCILAGVRRRPSPASGDSGKPSVWAMTKAGARLVFGDSRLRTLVLFAWLCGFYVLPEGIAAPYAAALSDDPAAVPTVTGLLMAAMPTGTVLGAFLFSRFVTPSGRLHVMGWMAMLSCAPLAVCAVRPPLAVVLALWVLSGIGGAYQLAANAAFVRCVPSSSRGQAFGLVQSGLLAAQGIGILIGGAAAQELGPEPVVALAGAAGLVAAALLTALWAKHRSDVISASRGEPGT